MKYEHTVDTVAVCMPIDEMPINIWFISIVEVAQSVRTMVSALSKKEVFDLWTVVCGRNIKLSIEV